MIDFSRIRLEFHVNVKITAGTRMILLCTTAHNVPKKTFPKTTEHFPITGRTLDNHSYDVNCNAMESKRTPHHKIDIGICVLKKL